MTPRFDASTNGVFNESRCRFLGDYFDALVLSHQVGLRKPRPEMFAHALQLARCRAEECLLIDDLPANVAGAKACGWQGIVYRGAEELRRELAEHGVQWSAEER